MTESRQQISTQLEKVTKQLKSQQIKVAQHKGYLYQMLDNNRVLLLAGVGSLFLGWKLAKGNTLMSLLKQAIKWGLISSLANIKTHAYFYLTTPKRRR